MSSRAHRARIIGQLALLGGALTALSGEASASDNFVLFESGQVRPLALSPSGRLLFATNTPDNRLEVFQVGPGTLTHLESVPVGLEPVAVAARSEHEVWVVNNVSDSVSVVDVAQGGSRVVRTLLVGDEPRDIVFAGPGNDRAFITTAHRGQNVPYDPQFLTKGVGRADVWVYDANNLSDSDLNGGPISIINLFTDTPRALAVTPDGGTVYAAGMNTGNQTTIITEFLVRFGPVPMIPPLTNFQFLEQPPTGFIVKFDGEHWFDNIGRPWDFLVQFNLPDKDVFAIDANANPPQAVDGMMGNYPGVGTTLYNMTVNPANGKVYVSNTDALNIVRFEGPGDFAGQTVQGHHNEHRITVLDPGSVLPRHLNKHIDFSECCAPTPNAESVKSLALPNSMAVTGNGETLYVAALGSDKVGIFDTHELENDTFAPSVDRQIPVSGGGPTGVVLDERLRQLFVLTRFDNSISIISTRTHQEVAHVPMFNPEPESVVRGRRFLYDATLSSHGDSPCASCHVFGDKDDISWDLGNPDDTFLVNNNPIRFNASPFPEDPSFAPMKGPLSTQSLRGMANHGPMHWRGDRTGSLTEPNAQPDSGAFDEREAFRQFQKGFVNLLGRPAPIPDADMEAFTDFILQVMYPPNPIRNLDNVLTPDQQAGRDIFFNRIIENGAVSCQFCHRIDPQGNAEFGVKFPGFFGTDGQQAREAFPQMFKIPHLRNLYTKVGMFGFNNLDPILEAIPDALGFEGDQIRGFGFSRAGDIDTLFRFVHATNFSTAFIFAPPGSNPDGFPAGPAGAPQRRQVEQFLLASDTNHAPIVGQQITLTEDNAGSVAARIDLLLARADAGDCELIAKASLDDAARGYLYLGGGQFLSDRASDGIVSGSALAAAVDGRDTVTFTCAPLTTGYRSGVDRDDDGVLDGDE